MDSPRPGEPFEIPCGRPARGTVTAPPSKSHAIRALVCAALAEGDSTVSSGSGEWPDDVRAATRALAALGVSIEEREPGWLTVAGTAGAGPAPGRTADVGGSGTALRALCAFAALGSGPTTVTGDASLRARPAGAIVPSLRALGLRVDAAVDHGVERAPVTVRGGPPTARHELAVDGSQSSQAMSALMLVAPCLPHGLVLRRDAVVAVSRTYVQLTAWTMRRFGDWGEGGARVVVADDEVRVAPGGYRSDGVRAVGDWSSVAFPLAAGAVAGDVEAGGVEFESPQGDRRAVLDVLADFGASWVRGEEGSVRVRAGGRRPVDADLADAPDLAPLVGALGCVATGTTRVRGAAHLRHKESDRIATVIAAARALGCEARELPDGFEIDGPARHGGVVATHGDHRIAMAFAVAGLVVPGVVIDDPACVAKSYPRFWDDLLGLLAGGSKS